MKHDPNLDTRLASAVNALPLAGNQQDPVGRTHGSTGVIMSVLDALSESGQLTQAQRTQVHDLRSTWGNIMYPDTKKPAV